MTRNAQFPHEFYFKGHEFSTKTLSRAFQIVEKYFQEKTEVILPALYLLKHGLASLQSAEQSALHLNAPDLSGKSAIIGGEELALEEIGALHTCAIDQITSQIDELTFNNDMFRLSPTDLIYDEPRKLQPGYSFITDERNAWVRRPSLVQHILQTPSLFQQYAYLKPDGLILWIPTVVATKLEQIHELQKKILYLIVLTYREPARGTELASHLLTNVPGGSIRNFFVPFNVPDLRASFNKTSPHQGSDRVICRFPLPELGHQFLRFLVFLRPLYLEWQAYLRPHMLHNATHYLFAGLHRPVTSYNISAALAKYTKEELEVRLTLRKYRQYMAFMTSCNQDVFTAAADSDTGVYEQFGHSADINIKHYGHDSRTPDGMKIKSFLSNARVSAVFHILYGHPPTLLTHLESGKSHSAQLIATIASIRGHPSFQQTPNSELVTSRPQSNPIPPDLLMRIKQMFDQSLAKSHTAITNLFTDTTTTHSASKSIPAPLITVHPYLVNCLCALYPNCQ